MAEKPRRTILCVDDEPDVVDTLFDTFMDDYNVKTACSGEEALKIFEEEDISLVISDQRMPEMEGTELMARVNEIKPICKKILLTGYADINAAVDAINKGSVDRYFSKPWDDEKLTKAVEDLLGLYSMDEFFAKAIEDAKSIKKTAEGSKLSLRLYDDFFDGYLCGVCLVRDGEKIEYVNKAGLNIMKYKDMEEIQGRDVKEIFSLDYITIKDVRENYMKKLITPEKLELKLGDGGSAKVSADIIFKIGANDIEIVGIVFQKQ